MLKSELKSWQLGNQLSHGIDGGVLTEQQTMRLSFCEGSKVSLGTIINSKIDTFQKIVEFILKSYMYNSLHNYL